MYTIKGLENYTPQYKSGGIYIKPENRGKFTATMKKTGKSASELAHSKNPLTRKRAVFALNARKWAKNRKRKHELGGSVMDYSVLHDFQVPQFQYGDDVLNTFGPTVKAYASQYNLPPDMLMSNMVAEGVGYGFNDLLDAHASKNAVKYTDRTITPEVLRNYGTVIQNTPTGEMNFTARSYPISGAEHFGLDVSKETIERLIEKGKLDKDLMKRIKFQETQLENGKRSTVYFNDLNDAFAVSAAVLDRKRDQATKLAERYGYDMSNPDVANFWTYVAYNGGAGTAEKMMADFQKRGLDKNNAYLDPSVTSPWAKAKTNASNRLMAENQFVFDNIPEGVMLPGAMITGKSTEIPMRDYPLNIQSRREKMKPDNTYVDWKGVPMEGYDFLPRDFQIPRRTDNPVPADYYVQDNPGSDPIEPTSSPIDLIPGMLPLVRVPSFVMGPGAVRIPFNPVNTATKKVLNPKVPNMKPINRSATYNQATRGSRSTTPNYWGGPSYMGGGLVKKKLRKVHKLLEWAL